MRKAALKRFHWLKFCGSTQWKSHLNWKKRTHFGNNRERSLWNIWRAVCSEWYMLHILGRNSRACYIAHTASKYVIIALGHTHQKKNDSAMNDPPKSEAAWARCVNSTTLQAKLSTYWNENETFTMRQNIEMGENLEQMCYRAQRCGLLWCCNKWRMKLRTRLCFIKVERKEGHVFKKLHLKHDLQALQINQI